MYLWECEWGPLYKVVRTYCPNPILICTFLPLLQGLWLQCCVLKELKKMLQLMQIWAAYLLSREKEEEGASRKSWNHLPLSLLPFVDPSFFVFTLGLSPIKGAHPIEPTSCITWIRFCWSRENCDQHQTLLTLSCLLFNPLAAVESACRQGIGAGTNGRFGRLPPREVSHQLKNWGCATSPAFLPCQIETGKKSWESAEVGSCPWTLNIGLDVMRMVATTKNPPSRNPFGKATHKTEQSLLSSDLLEKIQTASLVN